ncbi:MAG TPA: proline--tRNA ligase [Planctomycetia bacterium]|nr:proline--tRNA ligase [Planctomycetia bacterium]
MAKQDGKPKTAIQPTRNEDYPEWYQQVVKAADLAEVSPVRGCMVIKPWGYAIWENIQRGLDGLFKRTGHVNAYFPLFIPMSYLEKEAEHVEGFAKECAVVTHHRLEPGPDGGLIPSPTAKLEEPLIVRPTSETIIGEMYAKWVQSYRDLPILINQWANVVRWELRTRLFLRTTEFLWQEGHTCHATSAEAIEETLKMLGVYAEFAEDWMAMPVIKGEKTAGERFPGAVDTYAIESMMQDRKALQAGTSHFLGQNFAKAANIKFQSEAGREELAWTTSWGASTRLIGGLIMTHSDDDGLVLPPRLAPKQVVILPIYRTDEEKTAVLEYCGKLKTELEAQYFGDGRVQVELDAREGRGGEKKWLHVKRGVPVRVEVGPRDMQADAVFMSRRDLPSSEKATSVPRAQFVASITSLLGEIQSNLLARAKAFRDSHCHEFKSLDDFRAFFTPKDADNPEIHGGFALAYWHDEPAANELLKEMKVTPRCMPLDASSDQGACLFSGKPGGRKTVFAKAY